MEISFMPVGNKNRFTLHDMLMNYYRSGEDADTPQEEIDEFILLLFEMLDEKTINARLIGDDGEPVGFMLWSKDVAGGDFSEMPGYGTILEIGIDVAHRNSGLGSAAVQYAEDKLYSKGVEGMYVSAYAPAQGFWKNCGYEDSGRVAKNGLPIFIKSTVG